MIMRSVYRYTKNSCIRLVVFHNELVIDKQIGLKYSVLRSLKGRARPSSQTEADRIIEESISMEEMHGAHKDSGLTIEKGIEMPRTPGLRQPLYDDVINALKGADRGDSVLLDISKHGMNIRTVRQSLYSRGKTNGIVIATRIEQDNKLRVWHAGYTPVDA